MSDRIEPTTHIDILTVKALLQARINEGRELMKSASLPNSWKKKEQIFITKLRDAIRSIDEGIRIKEDKNDQIASQSNASSRKAPIQNSPKET